MKAPPLPLEEAQARLLALVEPLPLERVDCESAHLRYLAQPLVARRTQPVSDGWICRSVGFDPGPVAPDR